LEVILDVNDFCLLFLFETTEDSAGGGTSFSLFSSRFSTFVCFSITEKMACDLEDTIFMSVEATVRHDEPFCNCLKNNLVNVLSLLG